MSTLTFFVYEKPVSTNSVARFSKGHAHVAPAASTFKQIVFQYASEAARDAYWEIPECCRVHIDAWNVRLDADNIPKLVIDAMKGATIRDDDRKHVRAISVEHESDNEGTRLCITITPCNPPIRPKKTRAKAQREK